MSNLKEGDRVHLMGWEGECEGLILHPKMAELVGTIQIVDYFERDNTIPIVDGWAWPLSKVKKIDNT